MLPMVLLVVVALVAAAVLLVRRHSRPEVVAPEPPQLKPRVTVVTEAVPAPAKISGEVQRPRPVLVPPPAPLENSSSNALDTLDALLAELESTTVRIDGADAFDDDSVAELEGLAERLEAAAASLAAR
jgi:uncharacterized lipoprotein YbaY